MTQTPSHISIENLHRQVVDKVIALDMHSILHTLEESGAIGGGLTQEEQLNTILNAVKKTSWGQGISLEKLSTSQTSALTGPYDRNRVVAAITASAEASSIMKIVFNLQNYKSKITGKELFDQDMIGPRLLFLLEKPPSDVESIAKTFSTSDQLSNRNTIAAMLNTFNYLAAIDKVHSDWDKRLAEGETPQQLQRTVNDLVNKIKTDVNRANEYNLDAQHLATRMRKKDTLQQSLKVVSDPKLIRLESDIRQGIKAKLSGDTTGNAVLLIADVDAKGNQVGMYKSMREFLTSYGFNQPEIIAEALDIQIQHPQNFDQATKALKATDKLPEFLFKLKKGDRERVFRGRLGPAPVRHPQIDITKGFPYNLVLAAHPDSTIPGGKAAQRATSGIGVNQVYVSLLNLARINADYDGDTIINYINTNLKSEILQYIKEHGKKESPGLVLVGAMDMIIKSLAFGEETKKELISAGMLRSKLRERVGVMARQRANFVSKRILKKSYIPGQTMVLEIGGIKYGLEANPAQGIKEIEVLITETIMKNFDKNMNPAKAFVRAEELIHQEGDIYVFDHLANKKLSGIEVVKWQEKNINRALIEDNLLKWGLHLSDRVKRLGADNALIKQFMAKLADTKDPDNFLRSMEAINDIAQDIISRGDVSEETVSKIIKEHARKTGIAFEAHKILKGGVGEIGVIQYAFFEHVHNNIKYLSNIGAEQLTDLKKLADFFEVMAQIPLEAKHKTGGSFKMIAHILRTVLKGGGVNVKDTAQDITNILMRGKMPEVLASVTATAYPVGQIWEGEGFTLHRTNLRNWVEEAIRVLANPRISTAIQEQISNKSAWTGGAGAAARVAGGMESTIIELTGTKDITQAFEGALSINPKDPGAVDVVKELHQLSTSSFKRRDYDSFTRKPNELATIISEKAKKNVYEIARVTDKSGISKLELRQIYDPNKPETFDAIASRLPAGVVPDEDTIQFVINDRVRKQIQNGRADYLMPEFMETELRKRGVMIEAMQRLEGEMLSLSKVSTIADEEKAALSKNLYAFAMEWHEKVHGGKRGAEHSFIEAFGDYLKNTGITALDLEESGHIEQYGKKVMSAMADLKIIFSSPTSGQIANLLGGSIASIPAITNAEELQQLVATRVFDPMARVFAKGQSTELGINFINEGAVQNLVNKVRTMESQGINQSELQKIFAKITGLNEELITDPLMQDIADKFQKLLNQSEGAMWILNWQQVATVQEMKISEESAKIFSKALQGIYASGEEALDVVPGTKQYERFLQQYAAAEGKHSPQYLRDHGIPFTDATGKPRTIRPEHMGLNFRPLIHGDKYAMVQWKGFQASQIPFAKAHLSGLAFPVGSLMEEVIEEAGKKPENVYNRLAAFMMSGDLNAIDSWLGEAEKTNILIPRNPFNKWARAFLGAAPGWNAHNERATATGVGPTVVINLVEDLGLRDVFVTLREGQSPEFSDMMTNIIAEEAPGGSIGLYRMVEELSRIRTKPLVALEKQGIINLRYLDQNMLRDPLLERATMGDQVRLRNTIRLTELGIDNTTKIDEILLKKIRATFPADDSIIVGHNDLITQILAADKKRNILGTKFGAIGYTKGIYDYLQVAMEMLDDIMAPEDIPIGQRNQWVIENILAGFINPSDLPIDEARVIDAGKNIYKRNLYNLGQSSEWINRYATDYSDTFRKSIGANVHDFITQVGERNPKIMGTLGLIALGVGAFSVANMLDYTSLKANEDNLHQYSTNKRLADSMAHAKTYDPRIIVIDGIAANETTEAITGLSSPHSRAMQKFGPIVNRPPSGGSNGLFRREGMGYNIPISEARSARSLQEISSVISNRKFNVNTNIKVVQRANADSIKTYYNNYVEYGSF